MSFVYSLALRYVWYLVGFAAAVACVTGLYFYVLHKGAEKYQQKVLKQTEKIVQEREKTDAKINHLTDDQLRAALRQWVCHDSCATD